MKKILAIARLAMQNAVRSRFLASLLLLSAFVVIGLPLTVKGDGTPQGHAIILLDYTLSFTSLLLGIATAWAACATIAGEMAEHRLDLVLTKPVRHAQVWAGKWLGLVMMNALLLIVAGGAVYGLLRWTTRSSQLKPDEQKILHDTVFTARQVATPDTDAVERQIREAFEAVRRHNQLPANEPPERTYAAIRARLYNESLMARPGRTIRWVFRLPFLPDPKQELTVRFRFASSRELENVVVKGIWTAGPIDSTNRYTLTQDAYPELAHELRIPASVVAPDRTLTLDYRNSEQGTPATILFHRDAGLEIWMPGERMEMNLARALIVVLCYLAFLTALGLTAGTAFSLPVAAFVCVFAMILAAFGSYIHNVVLTGVFYIPHEGPMPEVTMLDKLFMGVFKGLSLLVSPITQFNPLGDLSEGRLIPWARVGKAFLLLVVVGSGSLGAAGAWLFRRKEIARAGER